MSHFLILALLYLPVAFISIVEFDRLQKSMRNTNGWGFKVLVSVFLSVLWNNNTGNLKKKKKTGLKGINGVQQEFQFHILESGLNNFFAVCQ